MNIQFSGDYIIDREAIHRDRRRVKDAVKLEKHADALFEKYGAEIRAIPATRFMFTTNAYAGVEILIGINKTGKPFAHANKPDMMVIQMPLKFFQSTDKLLREAIKKAKATIDALGIRTPDELEELN